jgi:hypothetical protein
MLMCRAQRETALNPVIMPNAMRVFVSGKTSALVAGKHQYLTPYVPVAWLEELKKNKERLTEIVT